MKAVNLTLFALATVAPMLAQNSSPQNSDVGILVGASRQNFEIQVSYARQFFESSQGRLYFEALVGPWLAPGIGVRYQINLKPRLAIYVAADGGVLTTDLGFRQNLHVYPAYDVGGGVDFRLTRPLSLRGEYRRFQYFIAGHHVTDDVGQIGFAIHF